MIAISMRHVFGVTGHSIKSIKILTYSLYKMNKNQTSKLKPKIFKNGYEYTILRKNQSNIRWKCNKVTCTGKVTTNLNEPVSYKLNIILFS